MPPAPRRPIFDDEHEDYRESFRSFLAAEVTPNFAEWDESGVVSRDLFEKAGSHGFMGMAIPEEYGGAGADDWRFNVVLTEESVRSGVGAAFGGPMLTTDICLPYLLTSGTGEQKARWLPGIASGETVMAIAMTEPGTGSDLAAVTTSARLEGDEYVVNGSKTFITNGGHADRVIVVAKTDPDAGHAGISLIVIDADSEGFSRGPQIEKLGQHASDTTELFFDDVRVPAGNLLGAEGSGFYQLMEKLVPERMIIAVAALAGAEAAFETTLEYVKERTAFGKPIGSFQNSRFVMAEMKTEISIGRAFVDQCIAEHVAGELTIERAAMAKWWTTELLGTVADKCLQLHGGYGYTKEYAISSAWVDARITRIYGGTTEIMKELIGRGMGL
ncbi:MAG: acyl-CoA dehydrogenase family protein [Solirubrobacterales bacterium]|nr:acyl-CoA dehydrogenase family protein [Solirubrobacterales bacterium]